MEEKKNNKGLVWLIVILIILVLGLVGYIVYDKVLLKDKTPVNDNETTTTKVNSEEKNEYIIKETKTSKNGIEVTLEQKTRDDDCYLTIGNNKITLTVSYCADGAIDLYDDFLTVYAFNPVTANDHFDTFDYSGNKLFDKEDLIVDENEYLNKTSEKYSHYYYISRSDYEVIGNKIVYSIRYDNDACQLKTHEDNCGVEKIKCDDLKFLGENINFISKYEIELIDGEFTIPKLISSTKLKDADIYQKAINSCE